MRQFGSAHVGWRIESQAILVVALILAHLVAPLTATAQPPSKVPRVGYLSPALDTPLLAAFRQGLRDLGWVEGQNIAIEVRSAEGKYDRLPELAAELVRLKVDVIFASTTPAALAAKHATTTIPIVIGFVADPIGSGLVASLAHPGGNITGWTHLGRELRGKYLELLKEAVPGATRIGVLWNPTNPIHGPSMKNVEAAAQVLKVQLHPVGVQDPKEIESAFATLARERVEALTVLPDGMFLAQGDRIISLAARSRLPAMYGITELAKAGGLMGYGVDFPDMYRRGASFVDRILKGAKPADLPVEEPTRFYLIINLKTAKALGLTIPQSILLRADELIQ
ncbi:MAG TPA: ABC transporter substrate-binding protein [archaeon]|nr:ABC transporter substrate-binding protein [archaeon]